MTARRAVFGALPPAARPVRVAVTWAFRDDPPDDPAAPWRGPWRARAAVWTGGLSAAVRARVESAGAAVAAAPGAALGDDADVEVSVARLDDADGVIQALRGGAPGAPEHGRTTRRAPGDAGDARRRVRLRGA